MLWAGGIILFGVDSVGMTLCMQILREIVVGMEPNLHDDDLIRFGDYSRAKWVKFKPKRACMQGIWFGDIRFL